MTVKAFFTFLFVLLTSVGHGQINFQKIYGYFYTSSSANSATILQTLDSGFLILGVNNDTVNGGIYNAYLMKTNNFGDTLWTKLYGTANNESASKLIQTTDGGFAFTGNSNTDAYLIKTGLNGDTLWTKKYSASTSSIPLDLIQTSDGGYIITGWTDVSFGNNNIILMKTNSTGELQWAKSIGGSNLDRAVSVIELNGSGYVIAGLSQSFTPTRNEYYIIKTDMLGNIIWSKIYGGIENETPNHMIATNDGGILIAGNSDSFGGNNQDILLIKIDTSGNLIWAKDYDISTWDIVNYVTLASDSGYLISGGINVGGGNYSPYILKINANGIIQWSKTIDTNYIAYQGILTKDNGFAIISSCQSTFCGISLIKTDSSGNTCLNNTVQTNMINPSINIAQPATIISNIGYTETTLGNLTFNSRGHVTNICQSVSISELNQNEGYLSVFPNPFSQEFTLTTKQILSNAELIVYNSFGQQVNILNNISGQRIIVKRGNLENGLYFLQLKQDHRTIGIGKLIAH